MKMRVGVEKVISVALLSKWHVHANDYAREAMEHPSVVIKKVWDEIPERGKHWAEELGVEFENDLSMVMTDPSIDAVIVTAPTTMHKEIILQAAKHKKHIFSEKVLAFTLEECEEIYKEVEDNQVQLMVNLHRFSDSYYLFAKDVVDKELLGRISLVRCRYAHGGAIPAEENPTGWLPASFLDASQSGGGALIDLGAHPIYLSNRLAGPVKAVTATLSSLFDYPVDDHAAVTIEYNNGALGILETSIVSGESLFFLEIHGTEGVLLIEFYRHIDNQMHIKMRSNRIENSEWFKPDILPPSLPSPMKQWIQAIIEGTTPDITKEDIIRLTQINELALLSHNTGKRVIL
jgi:scyllo-inositol 2-dehydrogenase (NAD+)